MQLSTITSRQMAISRVLCIFFMIYVHVNPGFSSPTVVSEGAFRALGEVLVSWLGRSSVAALSFFSGYIMLRAIERGDLWGYFNKRLKSILLPMLAWNLIYIALKQLQGEDIPTATWGWGQWVLTDVTGLAGPTANLSLFFLRDLFVCGIVAFLAYPVVRKYPWLVLSAAFIIAVFELSQPVIYRPSVLLFMLAGLVAASSGIDIAKISTLRALAPKALVLLVILGGVNALQAAFVTGHPDTPHYLARGLFNLENIDRRLLLVTLVLWVTRMIAEGAWAERLMRLAGGTFLTYLLHLPLFGVMWFVWQKAVGDGSEASYVVFFLLAPVVAFVAGQVLDRLLRHAPRVLQLPLRGKVHHAAPALREALPSARG